MQQAVGRIPFHICLLPSAYRLLFKCHRWDSNPHCPDSETGASCQLGYRGNHYERLFLPAVYCLLPTAYRFSPEAAGVEPAKPLARLPGFRDRSPRQWGQSFLTSKSTTGIEPVGIGVAARPPAFGFVLEQTDRWVRKDSNLRRSQRDSRSTIWRNRRSATHPGSKDEGGRMKDESESVLIPPSAFIIHPSRNRLVRESNPFQHLDRVPCEPLHQRGQTQTRTHRANWGIEPSPRHSQCRVLPLHQTRHHRQRKRRDSNPHRPRRADTFSKRVRRNRYSPLFQVGRQ